MYDNFHKENKSLKHTSVKHHYKKASLSVSESVCLFPNSSETANPSELKF